MRDPARLQAAIELADAVIESVRTKGAAADTLVKRYFSTRRYAGSKDRAAVRTLLFDAIRFTADLPSSGRALFLGFARHVKPELLSCFDGSDHAPSPPVSGEEESKPSLVPAWLLPAFEERFGSNWEQEAEALIARAPLDIRVNQKRASAEELAAMLPVPTETIDGLPYALRLPTPEPLEQLPEFQSGLFEIQDAGSQHVIRIAAAKPDENVLDLCAGAGGKTLGLAADMQGRGHLIASDTNRARLQAMLPRLNRAGLEGFVQHRLLNPGQEAPALADLQGQADLVLVDAPCSGTGTWRRNPELRWRLTPELLTELQQTQSRLLDIGSRIVRPGGRMIYAVCSILPSEGAEQAKAAASRLEMELAELHQYSPHANQCDGFAVAKLVRP